MIFFIGASSTTFVSMTRDKCSTTTDSSMLLDLRARKPLNWFRTFCDLWRWVVAAKHSNRLQVRARPHSQLLTRTKSPNHQTQTRNLQIMCVWVPPFGQNPCLVSINEVNSYLLIQIEAGQILKVIFIDIFSSKNILLFIKNQDMHDRFILTSYLCTLWSI